MANYQNFKLYKDGINAFPAIIDFLSKAEKTIEINMFIWRNDEIGNKIANVVLDAANRGVKVYISVDRVGTLFEYYEEDKKSMFHMHPTFLEKVQILLFSLLYPNKYAPLNFKQVQVDVAVKLLNHPNVVISHNIPKADHSKYYIIDDKILILGGINIEDKENGKDKEGRVYQDYMTSIEAEDVVSMFKDMLINDSSVELFRCNNKTVKPHQFHMLDYYLELLKSSNKRIEITMPYFSYNKKIVKEILNAHKRGVNITILIPEKANHTDSSNKKLVKYLMKKTNNQITLYFSPKMVHTKLMIVDDIITTGSCNINKTAFKGLAEINLHLLIDDSEYIKSIIDGVNENYKFSKLIKSYKEIKYNHFIAALEGLKI